MACVYLCRWQTQAEILCIQKARYPVDVGFEGRQGMWLLLGRQDPRGTKGHRLCLQPRLQTRSIDLTVAPEQQPCCVQVVERVGLAYLLLIRGKPDGSIIGILEGEG